MSDNVVRFPGITTLDLDADMIVSEAIGKMDRVVIVGLDNDGNEYFAANHSDAGEAMYCLQRAVWRLNCVIDAMSSE
jgi:hypothetical protein